MWIKSVLPREWCSNRSLKGWNCKPGWLHSLTHLWSFPSKVETYVFNHFSVQINITQTSGKFGHPGNEGQIQDVKPEKSLGGGGVDQGWEELAGLWSQAAFQKQEQMGWECEGTSWCCIQFRPRVYGQDWKKQRWRSQATDNEEPASLIKQLDFIQ